MKELKDRLIAEMKQYFDKVFLTPTGKEIAIKQK